METNEERLETVQLPNYFGELKSFCSMFSERSREENNAPYVRVWLAIMQNIVADEEKTRKEAVTLLEYVLDDRNSSLSPTANASLKALREYLCGTVSVRSGEM